MHDDEENPLMAKFWIQKALKKHKAGSLHRALGIKTSRNIPLKRLRSVAKKKGVTGRRARLAITLRGFHRHR